MVCAVWSGEQENGTRDGHTAKPIAAIIASEIKATAAQVTAASRIAGRASDGAFHRPLSQGGHRRSRRTRNCASCQSGFTYLRELEARRASIVDFDPRQGKMTDELEGKIAGGRLPRRNSKTFTFPISRSAAPRRKSHANVGWVHWPKQFFPIARSRRPNARPPSSPPMCRNVKTALDRRPRYHRRGHDRKTPTFLGRCGTICGRQPSCALGSWTASRSPAPILGLFSTTRRAWRRWPAPRIGDVARLERRGPLVDIVVDQEAAPSQRPTTDDRGGPTVSASVARRQMAAGVIGWTMAPQAFAFAVVDLMRELRERAEEEAIRSSHAISRTCVSAPAARARPWASIPGSAPAVKVAVVDAQASCSTPAHGLSLSRRRTTFAAPRQSLRRSWQA